MNWVQENKFLTTLLVVLVVGVGALGFLAFTASTAHEAASARYTDAANEFNRLRRLQPYPNKQNLEKLAGQKTEATQVINEFQAELAKKEFPLTPISPTDFQDELKKSVTAVRAKAKEAGVKLGDKETDKFYLGFDRYETTPPESGATAVLGRQLKAIEWVVELVIANRVAEMKLIRLELPEEKGKGGKPAADAGKGRDNRDARDSRGGGKPRQDLVSYYPFDVVITGKQAQIANILNAVISPKAPQFYVPRSIRVRNQKDKGPPRVVEAAAAPVVDPANPNAPAPAAPAAPPPTFIAGEELVEAAIRFDIVDFSDVPEKK